METHEINKPITVECIKHRNSYDFSQIHRHVYFEIFLFKEGLGSGCNLIDFVNYPILKHSLHIVYPNQVHLMKRKAEDSGIVLQFTRDYLVSSLQSFKAEWMFVLQSKPATKLSEKQFQKLYPLFVELQKISKENNIFKKRALQHYFLYTIFQILNLLSEDVDNTKANSITIQFLQLAENQFKYNRKVEDYAHQMNIAVRKLSNSIKIDLGKTPLQILHDLTAIEIKRLLLIEQLSQKEIAYYLNFDSPSTYTRFAKKHLNCSPTEFIQKAKRLTC